MERAKAAAAAGVKKAVAVAQAMHLAPRDLRAQRLDICNVCPHLTAMRRCGKCGCPVDSKVSFNGASCPIGKW